MKQGDHQPSEVVLDLPAVHRAVRTGRRVVQTFARTEGFEDADIDCLILVVSELLANAVDHGGGGGAMDISDLEVDARMGLRLQFLEHGWILEVEDAGAGDEAEARKLIGSEANGDLDAERGRGLFLVREMVDLLDVHAGNRGLVFVATKSL
jgi:anti-sigma regulatory factor (Ser/Thr protein kinase)